jgi:hypothetical protein
MVSARTSSAQAHQREELQLHQVVPLGNETFMVYPGRHTLYLMASAENPQFEGWKVVSVNGRRQLQDAHGNAVRFFPRDLSFRVSAIATRPGMLAEVQQPLGLEIGSPLNEYLLNLKFRLKIFRGLKVTALEPASVELIGVPADVPEEERVYRVNFQLHDVPTQDRVVLEVLSPEGERVCKFHLDLQ